MTDSESSNKSSLEHLELLAMKVEAEINKKARDLRVMAELINDGYWDWDLITDYEYMSPRFWEILGYDPATKKSHPSEWQKYIHPEDLKLAAENLERHIESKGEYPYIQNVRYVHGKTGEYVEIVCRGSVIAWKGDKPLRMIGTHTVTDIDLVLNSKLRK